MVVAEWFGALDRFMEHPGSKPHLSVKISLIDYRRRGFFKINNAHQKKQAASNVGYVFVVPGKEQEACFKRGNSRVKQNTAEWQVGATRTRVGRSGRARKGLRVSEWLPEAK